MNSYEEILAGMVEKYQELTGFHPDNASDVGIRMKTLAYQVYSWEYSLEQLEKQLFPQTAQGEYLDRHAAQRGISRKEGSHAEGEVTFTRNGLSQGEALIPAGTLVSTAGEKPVVYQTLEDVVLPAGENQAEAKIRAAEPGQAGNAAALAVKLLVTPISGIGQVSNQKLVSGGQDGETDEELRSRLLESYRNISNGSNGAYYLQEALACPGVGFAGVIPRSRGRGTVDVVIYGREGQPEEALLEELRCQLEAKREVNVDIQVQAAKERLVDIKIQLACRMGYAFDQAAALCREKLEAFLGALTVGQPLYQSELTSLLMGTEGVTNCKTVVSGGDVYPLATQIIRGGVIQISPMEVTGG